MKRRILVGAALVAIVVGILWLDHQSGKAYGFTAIVVTMCAMGMGEYARLVSREGMHLPAAELGLLAGAFLLIEAWPGQQAAEYRVPLAALVVILLLSEGVFRGDPGRSEAAVLSIGGLVYVCFLAWFVVQVRFFPEVGEAAFTWFLAVNKCTDIGAYLTGKTMGRHKLCPSVSPGKTWEGSVGGTLLGVGAGMIVWHLTGLRFHWTWEAILLAAVPVSIVGQVGDLAESLFKRRAGKKDSNDLFPSFGGFLDLLDCLLLSAPVAYHALLWMRR